MNNYRCKHCNKIVQRDSAKAWIKSYCDETGKDVHLMRIADVSTVSDATRNAGMPTEPGLYAVRIPGRDP